MTQQSLADIGESGFLQALHRRLAKAQPATHVRLAGGDDAALLRPLRGHDTVLSTDMMVEHVDFERAWSTFRDVGAKAAAMNLSDLAAMGAHATGLLASLAVQKHEQVSDCLALLTSVDRVGRAYGAPLIGGDMSRTSGPLVLSVTAVGAVLAGRALRRGTAALGDLVLVSGSLGAAAAGLWCLQQGRHRPTACLRAQKRPLPQVALGQALAAWGKVTACADISDGLAKDAHVLAGRGLAVRLEPQRLPLWGGLVALAGSDQALRWALHGGEDFQLVFSIKPRHLGEAMVLSRGLGVKLTEVGEVCRATAFTAHAQPGGFDHFAPQP